MGKRGVKPQRSMPIWSADLAYAVGLLVTDGSLSNDGRHIVLVSKDIEQLENFKNALGLTNKIGVSRSGYTGIMTTRVQFGDVMLYQFLISIGLTPNKTKTIGRVEIPPEYFFDFLRGSFDGDGCTYSYWDPRWKSSFMFYTSFISASEKHIFWLQQEIFSRLHTLGHITKQKSKNTFQLKYAKADSLKLLRSMYRSNDALCLSRKRLKIQTMLSIVGEHL